MNTCVICKKQFETWEYEWECTNCDDYGFEEVWRDWSFGEPDYSKCSTCGGEKTVICKETQFCSEDCKEEYFHRNDN